jgi:hypothetical protein
LTNGDLSTDANIIKIQHKMKRLLFFLLIISLFSCKTKKIYLTESKTDTVRIEKVVKFTPSQLNELVISEPCDSLGQLKSFSYTLGSGNDKLIVKTIDNKIYIEQNLDSIKQIWEKELIKSKEISEKIVEIPTIPSYIYKIIITSLILNFILVIFTFRKRIPFLNLL